MKRKMLIVSNSLNMGGLEKCLINFCNNLDYSRYDVDLYLFNDGRVLLPDLKKNARLLPDSPYYSDVYNKTFAKSLISLAAKKQWNLVQYRINRFFRTRLHKELNTLRDWHMMKQTMLSIESEYDIAIGFEEGSASYYVADCVNAKIKICWMHTDIKMICSNKELDRIAFEKVNWICTVSQNSLNSLTETYPEFTDKMRCYTLPTMLDYEDIDRKAFKECDLKRQGMKVVSVGRLVELKGFQLCVEPLKRLLEEGYEVSWYVAGEGDYRTQLEYLIEKYQVKDSFILLGNCENPYKFIHAADICVQPSSYEGFSIAVWEEKYLGKPVVATKIPSNYEMLEDGVNGILVDRTEESIYLAVKQLLNDSDLRIKMGKARANHFQNSKNVMSEIENEMFL